MKKTLIFFLLLSFTIGCFAAAVGDYRVKSTVTTSDWGTAAAWQRCTVAGNPGTWGTTLTPPSSSSGVITIQSNKEITIGGSGQTDVTADQIVVEGTLIVASDFQLTVENGSGTDLNVSGLLKVEGTISVVTSATVNISGNVFFLAGTYPGVISGSGSFTLASGATLETLNSYGISSSGNSGSVQTSTRSFSTAANYKFTSVEGVSVTGTGLPSTVNNLTVYNPYGLSLSSATTITNQLIFSGTGTLYLTDGDLTMGDTATISGTSRIGYKGTGVLINLDYVEYLTLFVNDTDSIPATIGTLKISATPVIPNDFEVNAINFNVKYFDLNHCKVTFTDTDAAFKGDSDVYDLGVIKSETSNTMGVGTSIERTWTTWGDFTNSLELQLSYPEALTSDPAVYVWSRPTGSLGAWTLVGTYATTGTDPRTVAIAGITDLGYDPTMDWTISTLDEPLPVTLSSFTGVVTPQNNVMLQWTTQSETNVSGYYVFHSLANNLNSAERINAFVQATNTSQETNYAFTDREATPGYTWYYWLQHIDMNGQFEFHGPVSILLNDSGVIPPIIPLKTSLQQIYPNPFNSEATVAFGLAKAAQVKLVIFNIKGEQVRSLYSGQKSEGSYRMNWNGNNENGKRVPSGVYFVKMTAGTYSTTQKLVLVK